MAHALGVHDTLRCALNHLHQLFAFLCQGISNAKRDVKDLVG